MTGFYDVLPGAPRSRQEILEWIELARMERNGMRHMLTHHADQLPAPMVEHFRWKEAHCQQQIDASLDALRAWDGQHQSQEYTAWLAEQRR